MWEGRLFFKRWCGTCSALFVHAAVQYSFSSLHPTDDRHYRRVERAVYGPFTPFLVRMALLLLVGSVISGAVGCPLGGGAKKVREKILGHMDHQRVPSGAKLQP